MRNNRVDLQEILEGLECAIPKLQADSLDTGELWDRYSVLVRCAMAHADDDDCQWMRERIIDIENVCGVTNTYLKGQSVRPLHS